MSETRNRYDLQAQFVPAVMTQRSAVRIDGGHVQRIAESALASPTNGEIDAAALRSLETVSEKSTPVHRAYAVAIKSGVVVVIALFATYAFGVAGAPGWLAAICFIVLILGGVGALYRYDAEFSPIGGERYKARLFADIRHHEIDSNERVSLAKLEAYTATLAKVYGDQNDDN